MDKGWYWFRREEEVKRRAFLLLVKNTINVREYIWDCYTSIPNNLWTFVG